MATGSRWWNELTDDLRENPAYLAEGIALDVAMKVSQQLEARGMARTDLARKLGVSKAYVSQMLNGHTNMTLLTLCKLASSLELPLRVVIGTVTLAEAPAPQTCVEQPSDSAFSATSSVIPSAARVQPREIAGEQRDVGLLSSLGGLAAEAQA